MGRYGDPYTNGHLRLLQYCFAGTSSRIYSKEECKKCFARFYCSGGCSANSYNFNGKIDGTYEIGCKLERKRVECALMVKAALALEEETENEEA